MSFNANVLQVLIASPGDIGEERNAVESALHGWNSSRAQREQVILLPRRWEKDSAPTMGCDGQEIINAQLVDKSDIVIALFDSKLGMATPRAVSGTAEEIERAMDAGKPVHVWFPMRLLVATSWPPHRKQMHFAKPSRPEACSELIRTPRTSLSKFVKQWNRIWTAWI